MESSKKSISETIFANFGGYEKAYMVIMNKRCTTPRGQAVKELLMARIDAAISAPNAR